MIHADAVRGKEIDDEFPSETTTAWILGLGYPEVTITTDGESSIVALSRKITEKSRKPVSRGCKTLVQRSTAGEQGKPRVVSELWKKKFARWSATLASCML